jgi:hypothetical protein
MLGDLDTRGDLDPLEDIYDIVLTEGDPDGEIVIRGDLDTVFETVELRETIGELVPLEDTDPLRDADGEPE